jgi:diguanylate cyclase (GGDEF)-like protein
VAAIAFVSRSRLPAFEAHAQADPVGPGGVFSIVPAGARPYYCFVALTQGRDGVSRASTDVDFCASNPQLIGSRTSGRGYDSPIIVPALGKTPLLGIETPLYRGGTVPRTVSGRRAAFLGWTAIVVVPQVLLDSALRGHPAMAVALQDTSGSKVLAFKDGHAPRDAGRMTVNLHDGSTVEIYAAVGSAGVFANGNSRAVLLGGVLLCAMLFLLALVLLTERSRALRLVSEKTEQLSFQAMHDGLTELPNRALVLDRIELMIARARRQDIPIAAMFIDVDGFKQVNDTFGHAAGDQLLRIIAARLSSVVRNSDTVGRLGGDEFVVLVEGETLAAGPEIVAERLLAVLRQPFELDATGGRPLSCSASLGIAVGPRATADELLRDADLAMYQAKQAGRGRYVLFDEGVHTDSADPVELEEELGYAVENDYL